MNHILLDGAEIYVLLILIAAITIFGLIGIISSLKKDSESKRLKDELFRARQRVGELKSEIIVLKLKYGELEPEGKANVYM